jgi:hypothetical protein
LPRGDVADPHGGDPEAKRDTENRHHDADELAIVKGERLALRESEIREWMQLDG